MNKLKSFLAQGLKASAPIIGAEVLVVGGKNIEGIYNNRVESGEFMSGGFEDGATASFLVSAAELSEKSATPAIGDLCTLAGKSLIIKDIEPGIIATTLRLGDPDESGR